MAPKQILSSQSLGSLMPPKTRDDEPSSPKTSFSAWQLYHRSIHLLSKLRDALKCHEETAIQDRARGLGDEVIRLRLWAEMTSEESGFERVLERLDELQHVILELLLEVAVITSEMLALFSPMGGDENSIRQLLLLIREGQVRLDIGFKSRLDHPSEAIHTGSWDDSRMQAPMSFWAQLVSQQQSKSAQEDGRSTISTLESLTTMLCDLQSRVSRLMDLLPTIKQSMLMTCPESPPSTPSPVNVGALEARAGRAEPKANHTSSQPLVTSFETSGLPIDVFVGIDMGLTCTGVAVCVNQDAWGGRPIVIQQWPGLKTNKTPINANKVPTQVGYKAGEKGIHSWGFECPSFGNIGRGMAIKDMFKFYLDDYFLGGKFQRTPEETPKLENVKSWYTDFLTALYAHIIQFLQERLRIDVRSTPIEFVFSIPTSWKDKDLSVRCFRELVDSAGFGRAGNVIMELTEGEASAVFTAKHLGHEFQQGEAFIVCDAGGGTTDMCTLQVKSVQEGMVELENLDDPKALGVGSVDIDDLYEARAVEQLRALGGFSEDRVELIAHRATRGVFQTWKTGFGNPEVDLLEDQRLALSDSTQQILMSRDELKSMFDAQLRQIIEFIEAQLKSIRACRPDVTLSTMFLAGGLGSSKYVQNELVKHFLSRLRVRFAPNPADLPLAVCKGLVIDRLQNFSNQLPVIPMRSSNASYGVLCREIYNSKKHTGQSPSKNPLDGKKYAGKQIDWLVCKGQKPIRGACVNRTYSLVLDEDATNRSWGFSVVCSTLEEDYLPTFLRRKGQRGGVSVLCHVTSDTGADVPDAVSLQRRALLIGRRVSYSRIDCELLAKIGVGKMEFTVKIIGEGEGAPQELKVRWEDGTRMAGRELDGLIRRM
ncbi:hypothetical protein BDZ45DRAFT_807834 [Acephala macrosclerotiorum]|nr:hypothetical protein BDZ45DRAFT_807834 [Acephala macrosclerotiorum]